MNTKEKSAENLEDFWQQQFEEPIREEQFLTKLNENYLVENAEISIESNGDQWIKIIKGLFLFLPGVALLFPCTLFGINAFFTGHFSIFNVILSLPWLLLCSFMVMFGIGDVKNPKHLALPISIVAFSFFIFLISSLFGSDASWGFLTNYSVYLFPIVFIIPILVRDFLLDEK